MFASAKDIRRDIANLLKPPRRMKVSEAVTLLSGIKIQLLTLSSQWIA